MVEQSQINFKSMMEDIAEDVSTQVQPVTEVLEEPASHVVKKKNK